MKEKQSKWAPPPFNFVGFFLLIPERTTLKHKWKRELKSLKYHILSCFSLSLNFSFTLYLSNYLGDFGGGGELSSAGGIRETIGQPSIGSTLIWILVLSRGLNLNGLVGPFRLHYTRIIWFHISKLVGLEKYTWQVHRPSQEPQVKDSWLSPQIFQHNCWSLPKELNSWTKVK